MAPRTFLPSEKEELKLAHQRLGIPSTPFAKCFLQRNAGLAGDGLFATGDIPRGTRILVEQALFSITDNTQISQRARRHQEFSRLHCPPGQQTDQRRFEANAFEMGHSGKGSNRTSKDGIFLEASRFNHSCIPNAHFDWNHDLAGPARGRLTVYAILDIAKDEQIFVNYRTGEYLQPRAQRQADLFNVYGFNCNCQACSPVTIFGWECEMRRTRMLALHTNIRHNNGSTADQHRAQIIELIDLLEQKEMVVYPQQADMYLELALWYERKLLQMHCVSDNYPPQVLQNALAAARSNLDLDIICTGYESPKVKQSLRVILRL